MPVVKRRPSQLMRRMGVEFVEYDSRPGVLSGYAEAPAGKIFAATDAHIISIHDGRASGWAALTEDLREGLADCDDTYCEICHPGYVTTPE